MFKNFAALGLSTGIRLLTGFVLFVLMAREWGAGKFGEFMYLFSIAALLVQACEYGFSQQILRDVGRAPTAAAKHMSEFFSAKAWLTVVAWLAASVFALVSHLDLEKALTLGLLLLAGTLMSYSDFLMACFRAIGRYGNETTVTLRGNLVYFVLVLAALYANTGTLGVAAAFVLGRLIHLSITVLIYRRHIMERQPVDYQPSAAWPVICGGAAYGLNVAAATAFVNLDTVLISHVLGFESAGTYQAAARFYQGAALIPPMFASIFLPKIARASESPDQISALTKTLYWLMLGTGFALAGGFVVASYGFHWIYPDPSLKVVGQLLPWFGLLVLMQFIASAQGITVTALGGQLSRSLMVIGALALMVLAATPLMRIFGVTGMIFALCISYGFLSFSFGTWSERRGIRNRPVLVAAVGTTIIMSTLIWKLQS